MKKNILLIAVTVISIFTITACKKSSEQPADVASLLMNKNWKISALTVSPAYMGTTDIFASWPSCEKDNFYQFKASNVFLTDEGSTKCYASDPQISTSTWTYDVSTKHLIIDTDILTITEINDTAFKATETQTISGVVYTYTYAFVKS